MVNHSHTEQHYRPVEHPVVDLTDHGHGDVDLRSSSTTDRSIGRDAIVTLALVAYHLYLLGRATNWLKRALGRAVW